MKRSEMAAFIYDEVKEALDMRKYSNETDEAYWGRRSKYILDMIEGFGMLPPEREVDLTPEDLINVIRLTPFGDYINEWEPE
jgi:hypothetical protein